MPWSVRTSLCAALLVLASACSKSSPTQMGQPPCTTDAECGQGGACVMGVCQAASVPMCGDGLSCETDGDCPTMACQADGCCAMACMTDADCPDSQTCAGTVCSDTGTCMSSADCPHTGAPVCNTATGVCQQCLNDNQCPPGEICDSGGGCKSAQPSGGCMTNGDCAGTPLKHCDTTTPPGRCVACLKDTDCSSNGSSICENEVCRTISTTCSYDGDCIGNANGPHCAASGKCVACVNDNQCPVGATCQSNNTCATAMGCQSNAMCPHDKPECRPTDHVCVECFQNAQCPHSSTGGIEICRNGYCVPPVNGCVANSDCTPTTPVCNAQTRTCTGCLSDSDCGAFCTNGVCTPCMRDLDCQTTFFSLNRLFCDASGNCVQCVATSDCSNGEVCAQGSCIADPTNGPCPSAGECLAPQGESLTCVQDGTATGTCRTICNVYGDGSECSGGTFCGVVGVQAGQPVGACAPPKAGAVPIGGDCSSAACDANGVCVPDSPSSSHCYPLCDPNVSSNCGGGSKCQNVATLGPNNTPVTLGACFPASNWGDPCNASSDCSANQACGEFADPNNPLALENACVWATGAGTPGAPCNHDGDCQTNHCIFGMPSNQGSSGFCDGACTSDGQCPKRPDGKMQDACESYPVPWHDRNGQPDTVGLVMCTPQCTNNRDCPAGLVCDLAADESATAWATRCVKTSSTGKALGGALCYADTDCFSNHCLKLGTSAAGICAGVCDAATATTACDSNAQCPSGGVVLKVGSGPTGAFAAAPLCWGKTCSTNAECPPIDVCVGNPAPANQNDIVLMCQPREGTLGGGAQCNVDGDCQSGWCVTWGSGNNRCFGACNPANGSNDCTGGSVCDTGYWTNSTPHTMVSFCAPP